VVMCKRCSSERIVKSGMVAGKQRFRCKACGCNFRVGDNRTDEKVVAKKLLCVLLHSMTKGSFRMFGKLLQTDHALVYRWIKEFGERLPEHQISGDIKQMDFDEMWHFIGSKKEFWSSKPLTIANGELWPGCSAIVMLQQSDDSTTK